MKKSKLLIFLGTALLIGQTTIAQDKWDYQEMNGVRIPTYGETIWHYPEGILFTVSFI